MPSLPLILSLLLILTSIPSVHAQNQNRRATEKQAARGASFKVASWKGWSGQDLYIAKSGNAEKNNEMIKIDILNLRYSDNYPFKRSNPVVFYHKTDNDEQPYLPALSVPIPPGCRKPLILLHPEKEKINHIVYDLNDKDFPFGSYKVVNFTNSPLLIQFGKKRSKLPPRKSASFKPGGLEKRAVGCKIGINQGGITKVVYSNMLMRRPHKRMIMFFYSDKDQAGRPVIKSRSLVDFSSRSSS